MIDEPLLTWKGRRVRSPGDGPQAAARKVPEALRPGSLFFVPSPLEGWGLETLLNRLPAECVVVVYEKDDELRDHCRTSWSSYLGELSSDPRLLWLEADTETSVQRLFHRLPLGKLRRCEFLTFSGSWMAHGPRYREIFARLDQGLTRWWSNRITAIHMGPLWIRNLFDNLRAPSFTQRPWPRWGDRTVLVCGAGYTLEAALPWAAENRDAIHIIAADTALPVLRDWGLRPDAVVCLESQHANLRDFAGWLGADIPLFADLTAFPASTRVFAHSPHWFISEFADLKLWERWPWPEIPRLPPLGSVGVAAAWIAWKLSAGTILLSGLDFSYPAGKTHARGAPSLSALATGTTRLRPLEQTGAWERAGVTRTAGGWLTTPVMESYAAVLADQAAPELSRTWVWDNRGLPLGVHRWPGKAAPRSESGVSTPEASNVSSVAWLEDERERLRAVLEAFVALNKDPGTAADLERQLAEVDYLTVPFPDPEFRNESDWLIRAQQQVRWLLARLG